MRACRHRRAAPLGAALLLAPSLLLPAGRADAQDARGHAATSVRYVTLRPIVLDSVARTLVVEEDGTFRFEGHAVTCLPGLQTCTYYRPARVRHGVVATQDVSATAWGFGLEGLSATILVRARADLAGDFLWPTADDPFDAILAYAELQRSLYRVRVGRQRTASGLGFSGFDGVELLVDPRPWIRIEAYGGRSLARGLYEPRHDALRGIEPFLRDEEALLLGGFLGVAPRTGTSLGLRYQREIWADRSGLVSERASLDVRSDLPGPLTADAAADFDFGFGRVGKAHLTLRSALPEAFGWAEVSARRYLPYFELSTIWGFFSPVAYHEAELRATAVRWRPWRLWASAGYRWYADADAPVVIRPLSGSARRLSAGAAWSAGPWAASGEYRLELGFGAYLSAADVEVRWDVDDRLSLTARGGAFQQIEEFRVGDNVVLGAGLGADVRVMWGARLRAGTDMYRQSYDGRAGAADWNQLRGHATMTVPFGRDPGPRGGGR